MIDRICIWVIKKCTKIWDRHDNKMAYTFSGGERKDYTIVVNRYFDQHYLTGRAVRQYNPAKTETVNKIALEICGYLHRHAMLEHGDIKLGIEKAITAISLLPQSEMQKINDIVDSTQ